MRFITGFAKFLAALSAVLGGTILGSLITIPWGWIHPVVGHEWTPMVYIGAILSVATLATGPLAMTVGAIWEAKRFHTETGNNGLFVLITLISVAWAILMALGTDLVFKAPFYALVPLIPTSVYIFFATWRPPKKPVLIVRDGDGIVEKVVYG